MSTDDGPSSGILPLRLAERNVQRTYPTVKLNKYPHGNPEATITGKKATRLISISIRQWKEYTLQFGSVQRTLVYLPKNRTSRPHHARRDQDLTQATYHHF
jgi:hypothetical protein